MICYQTIVDKKQASKSSLSHTYCIIQEIPILEIQWEITKIIFIYKKIIYVKKYVKEILILSTSLASGYNNH